MTLGLKKYQFPLTRPILFFFVPTLQFLWPSRKNKKIFIPTDPNIFQKIGQTNVRIAKIMLKIVFFDFLGVINFIICMFSCTVGEIKLQ